MEERRLALAGALEISSVAELRVRLLEALEGASTLTLDASAVERADTAGVQLLVALAREAQNRGARVALEAASEPLARSLRILGLADGSLGTTRAEPSNP